jgi:hypothetical protein
MHRPDSFAVFQDNKASFRFASRASCIDITDQGITVTSEHRKTKIHTNDESVILASAFARQPNAMERVLA